MDKELVDYFIGETNKKFERIEKRLEELTAFKWKLAGQTTLVSALITLVVYYIAKG